MAKQSFQCGGSQVTLDIKQEGSRIRVQTSGTRELTAETRILERDVMELSIGDADGSLRVRQFPFRVAGDAIEIADGSTVWRFIAERPARPGKRARERAAGTLTSPMVGTVSDVLVSVGQKVEKYQLLATVESMKVVARIEAPAAGMVKAVLVGKGEQVGHGQSVIEIEPTADAAH